MGYDIDAAQHTGTFLGTRAGLAVPHLPWPLQTLESLNFTSRVIILQRPSSQLNGAQVPLTAEHAPRSDHL